METFQRCFTQNPGKFCTLINSLGKNLGLTIIAEGVETEQQTKLLLRHECYYQQGYHFSRPIPYEKLFALIHEKENTMAYEGAS